MPGQFSQHDHAADPQGAAVDGWHELSVANPTFLLERLGSECTDLQGLRELTVNGLDEELSDGAEFLDSRFPTMAPTAPGLLHRAL